MDYRIKKILEQPIMWSVAPKSIIQEYEGLDLTLKSVAVR